MTFILGCQHVKNIRKVDFVEKSFASSSLDIDIYISIQYLVVDVYIVRIKTWKWGIPEFSQVQSKSGEGKGKVREINFGNRCGSTLWIVGIAA